MCLAFEKSMENNVQEMQIEALTEVFEYNKKLINALSSVTVELRGAQQEDTKEYLDYILKGLNWVIQVVNGTMTMINKDEEKINKENVNDIVLKLNAAIKDENNMEIANIIETGILPFVSRVSECARDIVGIQEN